jgi:apolipoprotein N-acyltransferase
LGGSLWVILVNLLIYYLLKNLPDSTKQKVVFQGGFILVAILLPIIWSLCKYSGKIANVPSVEVVVIQPNIDPYTEKFSGISPENQVRKIVKLAETVVAETTQIVLAPETALPDLWEDSVQTTKSVLPVFDLLQKFPDVGFIAGALTKGKPAENEIRDETAHQSVNQRCAYDTFNSALMISNSGTQIGHKQILVNGVEKMPFQEYFSFFRKYMLQLGGTSGSLVAGEEPILFKTNQGIKIGAVICFESAFGQPFGKLINSGAQMLVVLTNDGWLKNSPGVWQHFGYSRLRAIETRRSVVRSANTGISGIIDLRGKIVKKTRTGRKVAFSGIVNLNGTSTFYSRYGDWIGWISSIFTGLILIFLWLSRDKKNPH